MFLKIDHITGYRYDRPVELTQHLLRLRPRTTPGLHLVHSELTVDPLAAVRWNLDLEGNIVGVATFTGESDQLLVTSSMVIRQSLTNPFDFLLNERALHLPVAYSARELHMLAPYLEARDAGSPDALAGWLKASLGKIRSGSATRLSCISELTDLNSSLRTGFRYVQRHEEGVWSIEKTLSAGEGTCRDFAHLFLEAARFLGLASRYVSGYLCASPDGSGGDAHTHGWCELYLPGAGWRGFDPTNGILAGAHHVAVATSVRAGEIPPVEGSYCGPPGLCVAHDVLISARELLPGEEA